MLWVTAFICRFISCLNLFIKVHRLFYVACFIDIRFSTKTVYIFYAISFLFFPRLLGRFLLTLVNYSCLSAAIYWSFQECGLSDGRLSFNNRSMTSRKLFQPVQNWIMNGFPAGETRHCCRTSAKEIDSRKSLACEGH